MTSARGALLLAALTFLAAGCGGGHKTSDQPAAVQTAAGQAAVQTVAGTPAAAGAAATAAPGTTPTSAPGAAPAAGGPAAATPAQTPPGAAASAPASGGAAPPVNPNGACDDAALSGTPATRPPADMTVPGQARLYRSQGTAAFDAVVEGTPDLVPSTRDDAVAFLGDTGYSLTRSQDQGSTRALATLQGPQHKIAVLVTPLCKGKINIHYAIG